MSEGSDPANELPVVIWLLTMLGSEDHACLDLEVPVGAFMAVNPRSLQFTGQNYYSKSYPAATLGCRQEKLFTVSFPHKYLPCQRRYLWNGICA